MYIDKQCRSLDVTLDTNILVHADNPSDTRCADCLSIIEWLRDSSDGAMWVLDDQGRAAPDPATSVLYQEYREHVGGQSVGMLLLAHYLQTERVAWAPRPDQRTRKVLRLAVPRNKPDRAVVGAAVGSRSHVLVSNDLTDFPPDVRAGLSRQLGVTLLTSAEAVA